MIEILNHWTRAVLYTSATATEIAQAVVEANLSDANLSGAFLRGANLSDANLSGADLSGADLGDAFLRGANLSGANLSDADLSVAFLRGADLSDADLRGANLRDADLSGADLRGANLGDANLRGANLRGVIGLLPNGLAPLQILGTKHSLIVRAPGILQIGCMQHPVAWWLEHYKAVGRSEGYSAKQVAEYRGYIALARHWMKLYGVLEERAG